MQTGGCLQFLPAITKSQGPIYKHPKTPNLTGNCMATTKAFVVTRHHFFKVRVFVCLSVCYALSIGSQPIPCLVICTPGVSFRSFCLWDNLYSLINTEER